MSNGESLFSFKGRIGRGTFWAIVIPMIVISVILNVAIAVIGEHGGGSAVLFGLVGVVVGIFGTWIALATYVKRWHDLDRSGWMTLTLLIPFINFLIVLFLGFVPGTSGANKYGSIPDRPGVGNLN